MVELGSMSKPNSKYDFNAASQKYLPNKQQLQICRMKPGRAFLYSFILFFFLELHRRQVGTLRMKFTNQQEAASAYLDTTTQLTPRSLFQGSLEYNKCPYNKSTKAASCERIPFPYPCRRRHLLSSATYARSIPAACHPSSFVHCSQYLSLCLPMVHCSKAQSMSSARHM